MSDVVFGKEFFKRLKQIVSDLKDLLDKYKSVGIAIVFVLILLLIVQQLILVFFLSK